MKRVISKLQSGRLGRGTSLLPTSQPPAESLSPAGQRSAQAANDVSESSTKNRGATISWSPWTAVVFVIAVFFASQVIGQIAVSLYPALKHWSQAQALQWVNNSIQAQFVYVLIAEVLAVGAILWFLRSRRTSPRVIGLRRPRWTDPLWGLALLPLYYLVYLILVSVVHALVPELNIDQSQQIGFNSAYGAGNLVLTFISLVILPPIAEEIMVRGFLYTSLRRNLSRIVAALIASLIFAAAHLQAGSGAPLLWIAFIDTFTLSLFLLFLREKTGGLYASMTLHALKNCIAFLSLFIFHLK